MWEQIAANRRKSFLVVSLMGVILVLVGAALGAYFTGNEQGALTGAVVAFGIWFLQWALMRSRGDDILLHMANARQIEKEDHPQLWNVVEEMTIASSLGQIPRIFIVDDPSPNAFAVGRDPSKASVAVTIGLLKQLDRNELQGVIAHEIAHIKNRDVALMTTAGIMLGVVVMLVEIGMRIMFHGGGRRSRDSGGDGGGQAIIFLVAMLFLILAPILAQLIYFSLSRRREYLADASGAMFTRWPEGLASALEKIGGINVPQADQSRVTAPMYIVRPLAEGQKRSMTSAFSTHPPIEERVRILRGMGGQADFQAYNQAYGTVRKGRGVIGSRSLADAPALAATPPAETTPEPPSTSRLREASNAYLAGSGYETRDCPGCGALVKIPPSMTERVLTCPRCAAGL